MFADEGVVVEMGIGGVDAIDFFELAGAEGFVRIEAPDTFEKALAAENFVQPGDASGKTVGGVKESGVGVGDLDTFLQEGLGNGGAIFCSGVAFGEKV